MSDAVSARRASGAEVERSEGAITRRSGTRRADPNARVVAVTGACTFLGSELIKRLEEDPRCARVLALDVRKPDLPMEKTAFYQLDLTLPAAGASLAEILRDEGVDTVVHGAFLSYPTHATSWAHELEDIGTMHVLNACAEAVPARFVLLSTTMVYGASPKNPIYITEDRAIEPSHRSRYLDDRVRAELQVARFASENPAVSVAVLRFAPILGPTVTNLVTRFFSRPLAPVMMGHDPLIQFVHEADAGWALKLAVEGDATGPLNIVGKGVLPYTTVLAYMGRVPLPVPYWLARPTTKALWATQIFDSPPSMLRFLRYLCVADGSRAREVLGYEPRFSIRRTIKDFLGLTGEDDAPDVIRAHG
jgi:UDP-glucose 4-epimerase